MLSRRLLFFFIQTIVSKEFRSLVSEIIIYAQFFLFKIRKPISNSNCRNDSSDSINECHCANNQKPLTRFKSISSLVVRYILFKIIFKKNNKKAWLRQIIRIFESILDVQLHLQFISVLWKDYLLRNLKSLKE